MVYLWIAMVFVGICLLAKYTKASEGFPKKNSAVERVFFEAAAFLQRWFLRKGIYGKSALQEAERIKLFLMVFVAGDIAALFLWISGDGAGLLVDGICIPRKKAGEGSVQIALTAKTADGKRADVQVDVAECFYENAILQVMYEEMLAEAEQLILGENTSLDCVTKDLHFMESVEGYPFFITWRTNNHRFLSATGEVASFLEVAGEEEKEALVEVIMRAECRDFVREHIFFVRVCPTKGEKSFSEEVRYALENAKQESEGEEQLVLPKEIEGEKLIWEEKKEDSGKTVFLLGAVAAVAIYIFGERDLQKEKERRTGKMEEEYSAIISKLTIYMGAGMNMKAAFAKVAMEGRGNPVYEEMQIACREMESGISEGEAYERLGRRINKKQYIRMAMLLAQNLKKGNAELLGQLRQEAYFALEEKNMAIRKAGEEAGTKLLMPMMLLLVMVMVLIMVPAFLVI